MRYIVIKEFTDYGGEIRNIGDIAFLYTNCTYGVCAPDEIPLLFMGKRSFVCVPIENVAEYPPEKDFYELPS